MISLLEKIDWGEVGYYTFFGWLYNPPREALKTISPDEPIFYKVGREVLTGKPFSLFVDDFAASGERDVILASSGMGKSYLAGVLMEETLENDGLICVIDPEGECPTLSKKYKNVMIVGGDDEKAIEYNEELLPLIITDIFEHGLSIVFDVSEMTDTEQCHAYNLISTELFAQQLKYKRQIRFVVEEADIFAPQGAASGGAGTASAKLAKRGRKKGINTLWATQRPAVLNKNILSQGNRFWFGGVTAKQDLDAISKYLKEANIEQDAIKKLTKGQFYVYTPGKPVTLVQVRKRYCEHTAKTPEFDKTAKVATKEDVEKVLAKYKK